MVVVLTVGLSIVSRSITNLRTSTEEAESQKALAAAEAGIEQALRSNQSISGNFTANNTQYTTSVKDISGTDFAVNAGNPIVKDDGIDVWLSKYSTESAELYNDPWTGNITFYWGTDTDPCRNAALEIALILQGTPQPLNDATIVKRAIDPCADRRGANNFDPPTANGNYVNGTKHSYVLSVNNGLIAKLVPIYYNTIVSLNATSSLPSQGSAITSTGTSGDIQRKITVFKSYPHLPSEFFPYNLFMP